MRAKATVVVSDSSNSNGAGLLSYEVIANALFENYESIYSVDLETGAYNAYHESEPYSRLALARSGADFFSALEDTVRRVVYKEDQDFVLHALSKEVLIASVRDSKYHSVVYRIERDGKQVYHQLRATLEQIAGKDYALMGVRDVDAVVRKNAEREEALASERQKAAHYLSAILATAAAYTEANLSEDLIINHSSGPSGRFGAPLTDLPSPKEMSGYTTFQAWVADNLVCSNREKYLTVSSRERLLASFARGTARASVPFSIRTADQGVVPCRAVFYLYREESTGDVHALCVIYDLTDEQRREKEVAGLKAQLDLSRIRSSTSQMKPHFLYNALGSIQEVVLENPERAAGLLEDFTVYLRGCVRAMDGDDPIPFTQELENIRAYTEIEKMRLGKRLNVVYRLGATNFEVLPLSIQPLVENAIRHGIHPLGKRGGAVAISTAATNTEWVVKIADTGKGFDVATYRDKTADGSSNGVSDSTGLKNIRFRLEKILGATLEIESVEGSGTIATVRIPRKGKGYEGDNS